MASAISHQVIFNNTILNNIPGISINSINPYSQPTRKLNIFSAARQSRKTITSAFYSDRALDVGVYIQAADRASADKVLDTLIGVLQGQEGTLILPQSGGVRVYTCTLAATKFAQVAGGFMDFMLTFECSDNFGYDMTYTTIINQTGMTAASNQQQWTQKGTADTQVPFIQALFTAVTGGTTKAVTVTNPATSQSCVITRTWSAGDMLQIDCAAKTVQVNGVDVAFTGAIPEWGTGTQKITISDTLTTRTFNWFVYVYNRYV